MPRSLRPGSIFNGKCEVYTDYRQVLDRPDVDVVTIGTPDHWHSKIVIDALKAGKDVHCQKPLTLTIDEGKQICQVVKETGKILHIGTQQRSENRAMFLKAIVLAQSGRLGDKLTATCSIGGGPDGGPWEPTDPPAESELGFLARTGSRSTVRNRALPRQLPLVAGVLRRQDDRLGCSPHRYRPVGPRLHRQSVPVEIEGTATFPDVFPPTSTRSSSLPVSRSCKNGYNTALKFKITCTYANGNQMIVQDGPDNGIWFEGDKGKIFVNRGRLTGKLIEEIEQSKQDQEWLDEEVVKLYGGTQPRDHMRHFFECLKERKFTISDPFTHHRTMTSCHLCNIAILLKRKLRWDPEKEDFIDDPQASALRSRPQRAPYTIDV